MYLRCIRKCSRDEKNMRISNQVRKVNKFGCRTLHYHQTLKFFLLFSGFEMKNTTNGQRPEGTWGASWKRYTQRRRLRQNSLPNGEFRLQSTNPKKALFNCSVFPRVNHTFCIVKEFFKGWKKLRNNAHFGLFSRIYEFLTNFQK